MTIFLSVPSHKKQTNLKTWKTQLTSARQARPQAFWVFAGYALITCSPPVVLPNYGHKYERYSKFQFQKSANIRANKTMTATHLIILNELETVHRIGDRMRQKWLVYSIFQVNVFSCKDWSIAKFQASKNPSTNTDGRNNTVTFK